MEIVSPDLKRLFTPHVSKMRTSLEPGLSEITWTNFEWIKFTDHVIKPFFLQFSDVVGMSKHFWRTGCKHTIIVLSTNKKMEYTWVCVCIPIGMPQQDLNVKCKKALDSMLDNSK